MGEAEANTNQRANRVAILLFEGCDLLDSGGPYEVFLTASRLALRDGDVSPFTVDVVTLDDKPVTAYGGLGLIPTGPSSLLETADIVIIPGAIDLDAALSDVALTSALSSCIQQAETVVASVCTGSFLLGQVGALDGLSWTTHWEDIDLLTARVGDGATSGVRWVDTGNLVTGGALASGIAMSLHLVARFAGSELADRTAIQLDYEWTNTSLVS